ncbi:hypothetical protein [Methanobacterium petrolearium]|uniref:hypothetical protein n=1 Tax=Methanobacterium petrolearium TaxID=710190 RepID=UPI001AE42740|nr:hypothetical protein [Methanobacterium petrolearium]MBP1945372.1 ABC-type antimicrobial peptide transport system permease subunit [Methanobacterium petrolearium]BDZ71561.1 hypothetical protein GCM10025861_20780 [Methanobacterium petrolearium]
MNIRLVLLIAGVIIFSVGCGVLSFLYGGGITLERAYDNNQTHIVQTTAAGSVPHNVTITNNGTQPLVADKGTILKSKQSQDLVIIDDKKISSNTNETVQGYCIEPEQQAVPGKDLAPSGVVSDQIMQIIDNSNPSDLKNATNSQLQIWIIESGGDVDPYTGEASALVVNQQIKYYQLNEKLSTAKNEVMEQFNLTSEEDIQNIPTTAESTSADTWLSDLRQWINLNIGI